MMKIVTSLIGLNGMIQLMPKIKIVAQRMKNNRHQISMTKYMMQEIEVSKTNNKYGC